MKLMATEGGEVYEQGEAVIPGKTKFLTWCERGPVGDG